VTISLKAGSWEEMNEVFWTRELAWLWLPTPRDVAEGVFVRKEKEWCVASSALEADAADGADDSSGRS
jgi:hypothetical protein